MASYYIMILLMIHLMSYITSHSVILNTAAVIANSGGYNSSNVTIKYEYSGGIFLINTIRIQSFIYIECYVMILPNHEIIFNEYNNSFDIQFQVIVSKPIVTL